MSSSPSRPRFSIMSRLVKVAVLSLYRDKVNEVINTAKKVEHEEAAQMAHRSLQQLSRPTLNIYEAMEVLSTIKSLREKLLEARDMSSKQPDIILLQTTCSQLAVAYDQLELHTNKAISQVEKGNEVIALSLAAIFTCALFYGLRSTNWLCRIPWVANCTPALSSTVSDALLLTFASLNVILAGSALVGFSAPRWLRITPKIPRPVHQAPGTGSTTSNPEQRRYGRFKLLKESIALSPVATDPPTGTSPPPSYDKLCWRVSSEVAEDSTAIYPWATHLNPPERLKRFSATLSASKGINVGLICVTGALQSGKTTLINHLAGIVEKEPKYCKTRGLDLVSLPPSLMDLNYSTMVEQGFRTLHFIDVEGFGIDSATKATYKSLGISSSSYSELRDLQEQRLCLNAATGTGVTIFLLNGEEECKGDQTRKSVGNVLRALSAQQMLTRRGSLRKLLFVVRYDHFNKKPEKIEALRGAITKLISSASGTGPGGLLTPSHAIPEPFFIASSDQHSQYEVDIQLLRKHVVKVLLAEQPSLTSPCHSMTEFETAFFYNVEAVRNQPLDTLLANPLLLVAAYAALARARESALRRLQSLQPDQTGRNRGRSSTNKVATVDNLFADHNPLPPVPDAFVLGWYAHIHQGARGNKELQAICNKAWLDWQAENIKQ